MGSGSSQSIMYMVIAERMVARTTSGSAISLKLSPAASSTDPWAMSIAIAYRP
jgi:hypothetical protein